MEVESIEAIPLSYTLDGGREYGSSRNTIPTRTATLVRVETTDGIIGWGEAFGPPKTNAALLEEVVSDFVIGIDPYDVQSLFERVYGRLYHLGYGGILACVLSAVDIALWDVIGKSVGRPVGEILGARRRDAVTPYASTLYITNWEQDCESSIEAVVDEGFNAVKIKIGRGVDDDRARVEATREALGEDGLIMIDFNGNYRPAQAVQTIREVSKYNIHWVEEPVPPENAAGYQQIKGKTNVSLAAGEAAYTRFSFQEILSQHLVDVIQPDVTKCGGLSEARLIAEMAMTESIAVSPHCWSTGVGFAAGLQLASVIPEYPHTSNRPEPVLFEVDRGENELREELVEETFSVSNGRLEIPRKSGLGVTIDRDALEKYRITE
ncbi:mandelate racemase/muconate lactonizing enzyme family protein [Halobellus marinus]|uniref:mandelate racemase/muconate lactonizing enzyme family protein n=1 Tax=Halobellus TaxID=1073986 RepID=UPI0028A98D32|nr:mandelate racemase/muconate lactonizing enzyme family protein [Halobellus sp. DFY28]